MDDLDFSAPAATPKPSAPPAPPAAAAKEITPYDPQLALKFFKLAGELETFAAGAQLFAEREKPGRFFSRGARVYLLIDGEIALTLKGKPLNLVLPGEMFGVLAVISDSSRSATAVARKNSRVLSLDEKRFLASLQQEPEFIVMLISSMSQQLVFSMNRLIAANRPRPPRIGGQGLGKTMLADLRHAMGDPTPKLMKAGEVILTKGAMGVSMFVVVTGQVAIAIDGVVVEHVGPGEVFGETALLGPTARGASATAETDGAWLSVSRDDFMQIVKVRPAFGIALLRSMSERIQYLGELIAGG
jgi:CRP-like cAMP-binding protein